MASLWDDIYSGFTDFLSGGKESSRDYEKTLAAANEAYNAAMTAAGDTYSKASTAAGEAYKTATENISSYLDEANKTAQGMRKSEKDLQQEGKEYASAAANNKAGIAKRNAKAASMQQTGSKLMSAIQGAQGAVDAATQGYDTAASESATRAASQNNADIANYLSLAGSKANVMSDTAKNAYNTAMDTAGRNYDTAITNAKNAYDSAKAGADVAASNASESRKNKQNLINTAFGAGMNALLG